MSNYCRDIHEYDGTFVNEWHCIQEFSVEEKYHLFDLLMGLLTDENAKNALQLIKKDINTAHNFDSTNNICADEILAFICCELFYDKYTEEMKAEICTILSKLTPQYELIYAYADGHSMDLKLSVLLMLNEQLSDMYLLGQCPQGRCTRLYQIYQFIQ